MTYSQFIERLQLEFRGIGAWPEGATRLAEQLIRAYAGVLVVAREIPVRRLTQADQAYSQLPAGIVAVNALPAGMFTDRDDLGFVRMDLATAAMTRHLYLQDQSPEVDLQLARTNTFMAGEPLFRVDAGRMELHTVNATSATLRYAPAPVSPTEANYSSATVPLERTDLESAVQLIAAHVMGVRARDPQVAQYHSVLARLYGPVRREEVTA